MPNLASLRGLMIDLDGVLWRGRDPLPGVTDFFALLRRKGIAFLLVTNNATRSPEHTVTRLAGMGVTISSDEVLTSAQATAYYLHKTWPHGGRVLLVGEAALAAEIERAGFTLADGAAEIVVAGLDRNVTYDKLKRATLAIRAGAAFIATNPDKTFPSDEGIIPGAGAIIAAVATACERAPDRVVGKPGPVMFELALERLNLPRQAVAMLGDRLDTDTAGAIAVGMPSILVLTGVSGRTDVETATIKPDWVFEGLPELCAAWT